MILLTIITLYEHLRIKSLLFTANEFQKLISFIKYKALLADIREVKAQKSITVKCTLSGCELKSQRHNKAF